MDGLGHIGVEHVYYNGNKLADFGDPTGLKKLGVEDPAERDPGSAARHGRPVTAPTWLRKGTAFNVKEIEEVAKQQNVESARVTS